MSGPIFKDAAEYRAMCEWWTPAYIEAARAAYPDVAAGHELAVGWKLTPADGVTRNGYYWPLVNGDHDLPVLHQSSAWDTRNKDACPAREGDGLCLIPQHAAWREATSGGARFSSGVVHVLVYAPKLARGHEGKLRAPWVVDVDCLRPITGEYLPRANLSGADLSGADLSWANLSGADLSRANLSGANLSGADLSWANLSWVDLSCVELSRANLSGADLSGADLSWANLSGADLSRANLSGANLSGADLSWANLSWVDLSCVELSRANLSGADLSRANLSWANLSGADLSWANLSGANADEWTRWPAGFDPVARGVRVKP